MICGATSLPIDDATAARLLADGPWFCCLSAAEAHTPEDAVRDCTCWTPIHDLEQTTGIHGPADARPDQCHDCAYLATTATDPDAYPEQRERDLLFELGPDQPFICHQGMRRTIGWRHPAGHVIDAPRGAYDPPERGSLAWKADGTPADLCAVWTRINKARP